MVRLPWAIAQTVRKPWAIAIIVVVAVAVAAALVIVLHVPNPEISAAVAQRQPDVSRGEYIYRLADCAACHTKPGGEPLAGGLPLVTPMGTIYTTNITPDRNTGIGDYSLTDFARAVRLGVRPDGARLYPAMPYTSYAKMSDEDLQDLFGYLQKNIMPVKATAPATTLAWPYSMRWTLAFWNVAFLDSSHFSPDRSKGAQWNRGAYVVEALEHCGECHTPRGQASEAMEARKFLSGGLVDGWTAYNITSDPIAGIGAWSDDDLKRYLLTGSAPGKAWAAGSMEVVVADSTSHLTADDLQSVVAYLRTVPPMHDSARVSRSAATQIPRTASSSALDRMPGAQTYDLYCANCHGSSAVPVADLYPSMADESAVGEKPPRNLVMIILQGAEDSFSSGEASMPSFASKFDDREIADLVNYLEAQYGDPGSSLKPSDVSTIRAQAR
jgi:mono/diheme cytochrome c family protein